MPVPSCHPQTINRNNHHSPTHPTQPPAARFSPDDKFSRHRVTLKKRNNLLPTQKPIEDI